MKDKLISYNGKAITYSTNPLYLSNYDGYNFIFNGSKLKSISNSTNTFTYTYGTNGLRKSKNINVTITNYYYNGSKLVCEITGSSRIDYLYDSNSLIGFKYNSNYYYYIRDSLQNILGIIDNSSNLIVKYSYKPYGDIEGITDNSGNDLSHINKFRY